MRFLFSVQTTLLLLHIFVAHVYADPGLATKSSAGVGVQKKFEDCVDEELKADLERVILQAQKTAPQSGREKAKDEEKTKPESTSDRTATAGPHQSLRFNFSSPELDVEIPNSTNGFDEVSDVRKSSTEVPDYAKPKIDSDVLYEQKQKEIDAIAVRGTPQSTAYTDIPKNLNLRSGAVAIPALHIPKKARSMKDIVERAKTAVARLVYYEGESAEGKKLEFVQSGRMGNYDRYPMGDNARKTRDAKGYAIDIHVKGFEFNPSKIDLNAEIGLPGNIEVFEVLSAKEKEYTEFALKEYDRLFQQEVKTQLMAAQKKKGKIALTSAEQQKVIEGISTETIKDKTMKNAAIHYGQYVLMEAGLEFGNEKSLSKENAIPEAMPSHHDFIGKGGYNTVFVTKPPGSTNKIVRKVLIPEKYKLETPSGREAMGYILTHEVQTMQILNVLAKAATFNGKPFIRGVEFNKNSPELLKRGILETELVETDGRVDPDVYDIAVNFRKKEMGLCDSGCEKFFKTYPYEEFPVEMRGKVLQDGTHEQGPLLRAYSEFYYVAEPYMAAYKESNSELQGNHFGNYIQSLSPGSSTPITVQTTDVLTDANKGRNLKFKMKEQIGVITDS